MNISTFSELHLHEFLRGKLLTEFPDTDEETLLDTLEGLTSLREKIAELLRSQQEDKTLVTALKLRIDDLQERRGRIEARGQKKREIAAMVLERAEIDKIVEPDMTISMRTGPRPVIVNSEDEIPEEYWVPVSPKLDRTKMGADLKSGLPVPGAMLGNGSPILSVRVK